MISKTGNWESFCFCFLIPFQQGETGNPSVFLYPSSPSKMKLGIFYFFLLILPFQQDETGNLFSFFPFNSTLPARWNWESRWNREAFSFFFYPPSKMKLGIFVFSSSLPARCRLMAPATTVSTPAWQAPSVCLSPNLLILSWPTSWRSPWSLMASLRAKPSWHTGEAWWTLLSVLSYTMMPT